MLTVGIVSVKFRLIIVLILTLLSASLAWAQEPTPTPLGSYVTGRDIYVRSAPTEQSLPVGRLVEGDRVFPVNRSQSGSWILIRYNRGFGWIRRDLAYWAVDVDALPTLDESNLTPTPLSPDPTETPFIATATPNGSWVDAAGVEAFVRSGPNFRYQVLGQLESGTVIEPVGRTEDSSWILIRFGDGFAWIARRLVDLAVPLPSLPILQIYALTPSATFTPSATPTATATGTFTPTPSATSTPSATFTVTNTPSLTPTATFTWTPTATSTPSPFPTNTAVPTRTAVPSATNTASPGPTSTTTPSATATLTPEPSATFTATASPEPTNTNTAMPTETSTPTFTNTAEPNATSTNTATASPEPTNTNTAMPTETSTPTLTNTAEPTATFTNTATVEPTATNTLTPTASSTATEEVAVAVVPTDTATRRPSRTPVPATETPTPTSLPSETATERPTSTASPVPPTNTPVPTATAVPTTTATPTVDLIPSATREVVQLFPPTATAAAAQVALTPTPTPQTTAPTGGGVQISLEAVIGVIALIAILVYIGLYWRGLAAQERFAEGFIVETCPVCGRGHLNVETRTDRLVGIPRPRSTVRCTECRSVLRQVGAHAWRYAVDPFESPALYARYNGRTIDEETLKSLRAGTPPPEVRPPTKPPTFVDDEET